MKMNKKWLKVICGLLAGMIIVFVIIPIIINILFKKQAPIDFLAARWSAADALNYTAGALAFLGTMFLGWVSWSQNRQLQRVETNSFISQNSCMVMLESISFKGMKQIVVNLDTEHSEPIVVEKGINNNTYGSFTVEVLMKRLDNYAAFVRVHSLIMLIGEESITAPIFAEAYDKCFSRIAISANKDGFELTVLLKPDTKKRIMGALEQKCKVMMEIVVELVTANYVVTRIKCRGCFVRKDSTQGLEKDFILSDQEPQCFWYGNGIVDSEDIHFRNNNL